VRLATRREIFCPATDLSAIITGRLRHVIDEGHTLLQSGDPGEALFSFLRSLVLKWGVTDVGLKAAVDGSDIKIRVKGVRDPFLPLSTNC
jgi:hypothetical protein